MGDAKHGVCTECDTNYQIPDTKYLVLQKQKSSGMARILFSSITTMFQAWSLPRLLQLGFALFCLGDFFFFSGQTVVLIFGLIVLAQAVFNWQLGCATGSCKRSEIRS